MTAKYFTILKYKTTPSPRISQSVFLKDSIPEWNPKLEEKMGNGSIVPALVIILGSL